MEWIRVFSPATIGNIGPGFDVLGLAVEGLGDTVEARRTPSGVVISRIESRTELSSDPRLNTAGIAASEVLKILGATGGVELRIRKGLPSGSGLGSSAASAAAAAFAANHLYGGRLSREELIIPATRAEEAVSGAFFADNTAPALLGGATLTGSLEPLRIVRIGTIETLQIVLVMPELTVLTREARAVLPRDVPMKSFISNMAHACLVAAAFARNDYSLLAGSLKDVVVEPARGKLIRGFEEVRRSAIEAGADGVAISGSGPALFAITDSPEKARLVAESMVRAFEGCGVRAESLVSRVDPEGTRLVV